MNGRVEQLINELQSADAEMQAQAAYQIANNVNAYATGFSENIPALAIALKNENENIRFNISYTLVCLAEKGKDLSAITVELTECLSDSNQKIQKEALWALVCIGAQGKSLDSASEVLEDLMKTPNHLTGNGAIALALHYLNKEEFDKADALFDTDAGTGFGVSYAAAVYAIRSGNAEPLKKALRRIRFGLSDRDKITGVAGALNWAKDVLGWEIDVPVKAIREVHDESDDMAQQAAINGIFMQMNR